MRSILRRELIRFLRACVRLTGKRGQRLLSAALSDEGSYLPLTIDKIATPRGPISFYCLGELPAWRAETLLTKEPETIEWIESFAPGDVLWDIGANVGIYSLYAALGGRAKVLAFEPAAANYALLNRNIELNGLASDIQAFCIAFNDRTRLDALNMQMTDFGGSMSSFGEAIDSHGRNFRPMFRQGMVGYSVDDFLAQFQPLFPNHLKIDVDGIEDRIVASATKVLRDARMKSISIELDATREAYTQSVVNAIEAAGFVLTAKRNSEMVAGGEFKDIFNYQFRRPVAGN